MQHRKAKVLCSSTWYPSSSASELHRCRHEPRPVTPQLTHKPIATSSTTPISRLQRGILRLGIASNQRNAASKIIHKFKGLRSHQCTSTEPFSRPEPLPTGAWPGVQSHETVPHLSSIPMQQVNKFSQFSLPCKEHPYAARTALRHSW